MLSQITTQSVIIRTFINKKSVFAQCCQSYCLAPGDDVHKASWRQFGFEEGVLFMFWIFFFFFFVQNCYALWKFGCWLKLCIKLDDLFCLFNIWLKFTQCDMSHTEILCLKSDDLGIFFCFICRNINVKPKANSPSYKILWWKET